MDCAYPIPNPAAFGSDGKLNKPGRPMGYEVEESLMYLGDMVDSLACLWGQEAVAAALLPRLNGPVVKAWVDNNLESTVEEQIAALNALRRQAGLKPVGEQGESK